jgi:hypothetical protein
MVIATRDYPMITAGGYTAQVDLQGTGIVIIESMGL